MPNGPFGERPRSRMAPRADPINRKLTPFTAM
jgi:hypothetical protein